MKFLCDVHISIKLVKHLNNLGFECIHVNSILDKWFTTDIAIAKYSDANDFILVTKDFDFKNSFLVNKTPKKLLKINLSNISNSQLIEIFNRFIAEIETIHKNNNQFMIEVEVDYFKVTSL